MARLECNNVFIQKQKQMFVSAERIMSAPWWYSGIICDEILQTVAAVYAKIRSDMLSITNNNKTPEFP
ncbi:MAG: hypothetical protein E7330_00585 [Clostridiales bacterium]|nr:hypothetical protein [Clostridiales bacterium]